MHTTLLSRAQFEASCGPRGALLVGSPEEVAAKIIAQHEIFGRQRFLLQLTVGAVPHDEALHAIELYATKVAPLVRRDIGARTESRAAPAR